MSYLLFPGRHLLNTAFQARYLRGVLQMPPGELEFWGNAAASPLTSPLNHLIFAVTSANQQHSRYNPIPFHVRAIGIDRFAREMEMSLDIQYRIFGIPHYDPTPRFARHVLREIEEQSEGGIELTPANCVVLCSTPSLIQQYQELGFAILPAEWSEIGYLAETPLDLVKVFVQVGENWATHAVLRDKMAPTTFDLWQDFPEIPHRILRLWRDPLLNDEGSLTKDRDYASYAYGMSNNAIIGLKYDDIKPALVPGKIVDEGCADGALLAYIADDFPDSDLIGIEITGEFMARCLERQRAGDFGGSFVYFHQRNITQPIFEPGSIDTTICNSTTHELWSYGQQEVTVRAYLGLKFAQTAKGGRLIIRDVVGPENGDEEVYLWLNREDGSNQDVFADCPTPKALQTHLDGLSTYSRFKRFARDFLAEARANGHRGPETIIHYREETINGKRLVVLALHAAAEFLSKKDYTDNWASEMHEEFAFWGFSQWKAALHTAGFQVLENPNTPQTGSRVYTNPWIVENRYLGKAELFRRVGEKLEPIPYPVTNIVLVGEKLSQ